MHAICGHFENSAVSTFAGSFSDTCVCTTVYIGPIRNLTCFYGLPTKYDPAPPTDFGVGSPTFAPRSLRSADTRTLLVSRTLTNFGDRAFIAAGPRVWNNLPTDLRQPDLSYSRFRHFNRSAGPQPPSWTWIGSTHRLDCMGWMTMTTFFNYYSPAQLMLFFFQIMIF